LARVLSSERYRPDRAEHIAVVVVGQIVTAGHQILVDALWCGIEVCAGAAIARELG
jgi:hypothetical protein